MTEKKEEVNIFFEFLFGSCSTVVSSTLSIVIPRVGIPIPIASSSDLIRVIAKLIKIEKTSKFRIRYNKISD